jgi:MoaA/NifB/PqqE/SkfB family radical SAM enzyme
MNTNGTLLDAAACTWLSQVDAFEVRISIDGPTPSVHDRVRGLGAFDQTIHGHRLLAERGVMDSVNLTIGRHNRHCIADTLDLAVTEQFHHVHIYAWESLGRGADVDQRLTPLMVSELQQSVAAVATSVGIAPAVADPKSVACGDAPFLIMVWPDGSVVPHIGAVRFEHEDHVITNIAVPDFEADLDRYLESMGYDFCSCSGCRWFRTARCYLTNAFCAADVALPHATIAGCDAN